MHIRTVHVCPVALYVVQFYHHKTISDRILRRRRVFFSPSAAERLFFTCYVYIYKRWWQCQRGDYIDNGEKNKGYISKLLLYWLHKSRHTAIDAPMGTGKNTRLVHDKHTPRVLCTDVNCRSFLFVARLDFNICTYCKKGKLSVRVNYRSDTMYCVIKEGTDHCDAESLRQTPLLLAYWSKKKKSKGYLLDKYSRDHVYSREAVVTNET